MTLDEMIAVLQAAKDCGASNARQVKFREVLDE